MRIVRWTPFAFGVVLTGLFALSTGRDQSPSIDSLPYFEREIQRLETIQPHLDPSTPRAAKVRRKLEDLRERRATKPMPDGPEEFARILYEMQVPNDADRPGYQPGYKRTELAAAKARRTKAATTLPWVPRGPGNVAGRVRGIFVDPADATGNTWIVGAVGGGLWRTTNGGNTWIDLAPDLPTYPISWLAHCESAPSVIYAGTGASFFQIDAINGNGILKSTNGGTTWAPLASTVDNPLFQNVSRVLVDPNDPDIVLASTTAGFYKTGVDPTSNILRSTDGGANWTTVHTEASNRILQIIATPGFFDVQYAGVYGKGVLKSTDAGQTWADASVGINDAPGRFELAVSPVNPNMVFASAQGTGTTSKLWVSSDTGNTWIETFESGGPEPGWLGGQGWYDNTIVCHPTNQNIVYVGGIRLWQIQLTGATDRVTTQLNSGPVHVDHHHLTVIPDGGGGWRLINGNDGGIGISASQASNWSAPIDGMTTGQFYGVDKRPGASAYVGGMQDNGTWRSPIDPARTTPWNFQIGGDGYETSWHFEDPQKIIGGFQFNGLRRSLNGGLSWSSATSGLTDTGSGMAPFITKIAKSNKSPDLLFAVGASGVWRSTDFGGSWSLTPISSPDWAPNNNFVDVRISRADPDIVWAGARMDGVGRINVSTDGGVSFSPTTNYVEQTVGMISGLSTHPTQPNTAYTLFSFAQRTKIVRTEDLGNTWVDITGFGTGTVSTNGFPDVAIYDLLVMPNDPNTIWAGTEIGLVESTDNGASWQIADNGLPPVPIWFMTHVEDEIVLATHGRGVYSVEIPGLSSGETFNPLLEVLSQGPDGMMNVHVRQRSPYDETQIWVDGSLYTTLPANAAATETMLQVPVISAGTRTVKAISTVGATPYESVERSLNVVVYAAPAFSYENDFGLPTTDFQLNGQFAIHTESLFVDNEGLHTAFHPYLENTGSITTLLTQPITVAVSSATLEFDEVVLVEPGLPGTVFGDFEFWDYVIVEGSLDGSTWLPLLDGYDSDADPAWRSAYDMGLPGDQSMWRHRVINLLDTFAPGDDILVRFRLFSDSSANAWGWAIDNLEIQVNAPTSVGDEVHPRRFALDQNSPNPFNPVTSIRYRLAAGEHVRLKVYDLRGRQVRTLVDEPQVAGAYTVAWDGRDHGGAVVASGTYVYRLEAGDFVQHRKMTLVK